MGLLGCIYNRVLFVLSKCITCSVLSAVDCCIYIKYYVFILVVTRNQVWKQINKNFFPQKRISIQHGQVQRSMKSELSFMLQPSGPEPVTVTRANVQTAEEYVAEVQIDVLIYLLIFVAILFSRTFTCHLR